jgi:hypothetical protein
VFEINEKSTAYVTAAFADKAGVAAVPTAVTYRVDCKSTGAALVAETSASAAASVEIAIPPTANAIQDPTNDFEVKVVTVTASYGASDQITAAYHYRVRNLSKIN